jgi:hypothetical protein
VHTDRSRVGRGDLPATTLAGGGRGHLSAHCLSDSADESSPQAGTPGRGPLLLPGTITQPGTPKSPHTPLPGWPKR